MTITLTPEIEARLHEQAKWNEMEVHALAQAYITVMLEWGEQEVKESLEITARSMADFEAGRCRPASETMARLRDIARIGHIYHATEEPRPPFREFLTAFRAAETSGQRT